MIVHINGSEIKSELDFHKALTKVLDFGPYYGFNLHALWDRLSTDIERPVTIIWNDSEKSKLQMGNRFQYVVDVLKRVEQQDLSFNLKDRFTFELRC